MRYKFLLSTRALVLVVAGAIALPVLADPEGHDKHRRKGHGQSQGDQGDDHRRRGDDRGHSRDGDRGDWRRDDRIESRRDDRREERFEARREHRREHRHERHFADDHRTIVHEYYRESWRSGRCPPGLAKRHNGCMPPGHARRWEYGRRLPREVVFHDVPPALVVQLGVPRPGHRYVRVGADILLIALGTAIVVDAIEDLGD